jgi:hypothetical protein
MRSGFSLLLALLAAAPPSAAQTPSDIGWRLGGGVEAVRFAWVAQTTAASGVAVELRPSGRAAAHFTAGRSYGPWQADLEIGWAGGHILASNEAVSIEDRSSDVTRYRLAPGLGRRVATLGQGEVVAVVAPTIDLWSVDGDSRLRAGAEGRLLLRARVGPMELENRVAFGLSASPIGAADIGEASDQRALRSVSAGIGVRVRP